MLFVFTSPLQIQDVAEQGVMFVGFLQQPGGGPCFFGHWDPEELSSLHSSPSPIHRHPFSPNISPSDPTEPHQNGVEPDRHSFEPQELDHESIECNTPPVVPRDPDVSPLKSSWSSDLSEETDGKTKQPQTHCKPGVDTVQRFPSQSVADTQRSQLCPSPYKIAGSLRPQECSLPDYKESTEEHFNLPNQKQKRGSSSDSWFSSPEPDRSSDKISDGQNRETTQNNNHIRLKNLEKENNATSPSAQASKYQFSVCCF